MEYQTPSPPPASTGLALVASQSQARFADDNLNFRTETLSNRVAEDQPANSGLEDNGNDSTYRRGEFRLTDRAALTGEVDPPPYVRIRDHNDSLQESLLPAQTELIGNVRCLPCQRGSRTCIVFQGHSSCLQCLHRISRACLFERVVFTTGHLEDFHWNDIAFGPSRRSGSQTQAQLQPTIETDSEHSTEVPEFSRADPFATQGSGITRTSDVLFDLPPHSSVPGENTSRAWDTTNPVPYVSDILMGEDNAQPDPSASRTNWLFGVKGLAVSSRSPMDPSLSNLPSLGPSPHTPLVTYPPASPPPSGPPPWTHLSANPQTLTRNDCGKLFSNQEEYEYVIP